MKNIPSSPDFSGVFRPLPPVQCISTCKDGNLHESYELEGETLTLTFQENPRVFSFSFNGVETEVGVTTISEEIEQIDALYCELSVAGPLLTTLKENKAGNLLLYLLFMWGFHFHGKAESVWKFGQEILQGTARMLPCSNQFIAVAIVASGKLAVICPDQILGYFMEYSSEEEDPCVFHEDDQDFPKWMLHKQEICKTLLGEQELAEVDFIKRYTLEALLR